MDGDIVVGIPVSAGVADLLKDPGHAKAIGRLVSDLLRPASPEHDPIAPLIARIKAEARADGLTDADVDAELAAYNAERRS